jgi:integrase
MPASDSRKLERTKTPGVYRRGDTYIARWKHRGQSHKRMFRTYAEAREFKRTLHGAGTQPTTRETVADYFEKWIGSYRGRTARGLEETTRAEYRRSFDLHVLPFPIARERLRDVTSRDVADWFTDLERAGVKPPSVRKAKAAISAMLATAAQAGDIGANPAARVRYVPQPPLRLEGGEDLVHVLDAQRAPLALHGLDLLFFELLAQSGCRVGELLGLTWGRVHLGDDPQLLISEQVYRGRRKRLKTAGSERTIPLSPGMAQALTSRKGAADAPVFPSAVGTPMGYSNLYNRVLQPALRACGLDGQGVAFHAFRKACGSVLLLRAGKDPRQVQRWLGHSQLTTTMNVYVHELYDGLGGADELEAAWGHPGATLGPPNVHEQPEVETPETASESGIGEQSETAGSP